VVEEQQALRYQQYLVERLPQVAAEVVAADRPAHLAVVERLRRPAPQQRHRQLAEVAAVAEPRALSNSNVRSWIPVRRWLWNIASIR
jgi:hypothetical protein